MPSRICDRLANDPADVFLDLGRKFAGEPHIERDDDLETRAKLAGDRLECLVSIDVRGIRELGDRAAGELQRAPCSGHDRVFGAKLRGDPLAVSGDEGKVLS